MIFLKTISVLFATLILFTNVSAASAPTVERKIVPLTIPEKIVKYADRHNVSADVMSKIINCESRFKTSATNHTEVEYSVGLVQINLYAHTNISEETARDEDFAIEFLAKHLASGEAPRMWFNCYNKL